MAGKDTPGDIIKIGKVPGGVKLPNGMFFSDKNKGKLISYLRNNPGYVWKNRRYLRSQIGDETLGLAGYRIPSDGKTMHQYEYSGIPGTTGGKLLRTWTPSAKDAAALAAGPGKVEGTKVIHAPSPVGPKFVPKPKAAPAKPPAKPTAKKPPKTATSASGVYKAPQAPASTVTSRGPATSTASTPAAGKPGTDLFATALKSLLGLNPNAGFHPLDANAILAGLGQSTAQQTQTIRDQMASLDKEGAFNAGKIDQWFGKVGSDVERARTRGQDMTAALGSALTGNNQAILESIGGAAAPGASAVGQIAQSGQNTLAALGAADAQFLNDIGPMLTGEAANLKASDLARLSQMKRDYTNQLTQIGADDSDKRAALALQIAQANNAGGQQRFQNAAGLAETMAGLALSGQKLTLAQQQAIAALAQKQQSMALGQANEDRQYGLDVTKAAISGQNQAADNSAAQARSLDQKLNAANSDIAKIDVNDYPLYKRGGLAPTGLVEDVLNMYRSYGVDLTDPRARKAAQAAIKTFGVNVDPRWVAGWR